MKIGISTLVTPSRKVGVGEYVKNLIHHLQQIDDENQYTIFTAPDTRHLFELYRKNFHEICVNIRQNIKIVSPIATVFWLHTGLRLLCRKRGIDIIHIPNTQLIVQRHSKTVVSILDLGEWHFKRYSWLRSIYRKSANYVQAHMADHILTISASSKYDIIKYLSVPPEKISVTYLAAADQFYRKIHIEDALEFVRLHYKIKKPFLLSVGSHKKHKNIEGILKAFYRIKAMRKYERKLVLVGKKENASEAIRAAIQRLKLQRDIVFTGYVNDKHLPFLYTAAKMFLFPSFWEGFGIPIIEAMACGCPVICSNTASMPEVAGKNAVLIDPYNIDSIAEAILKIEDDVEFEMRMKTGGPIQAAKFRFRTTAENTLRAYTKVCNAED